MSRHSITLIDKGRIVRKALIGYNAILRTYDLRVIENEDNSPLEPDCWLDSLTGDYQSLDSLIRAVWELGYRIDGLDSTIILGMLAQAEGFPEQSLAERLGL